MCTYSICIGAFIAYVYIHIFIYAHVYYMYMYRYMHSICIHNIKVMLYNKYKTKVR